MLNLKVGIITVVARRREYGHLKIGIQSDNIFYTRNDNEVYPITQDTYVLMKREN